MDPILADTLDPDRAQQAVTEKRVLLERLMARLAHEIRNPLSSLDVHVQLLEEDLVSASPQIASQLASRLEIIRGELHRLESIVGHFLKLAGPSALDPAPLSAAKVASHVCDLLRPEAAARDIQIHLSAPSDLPLLQADQVRLTQALVNMVINAIQAVKRNGEIRVEISSTDTAMTFKVSDNGPGIPEEKLASIFDPYFTTKEEGCGLGLWIAQQIVTAHGGCLNAENQPGGGALFRMSLPVKLHINSQ